MVSSQSALIAATVGLTQRQGTCIPTERRWSIAQCATAPSPAAFNAEFLSRRAATLQYVRETNDALHHHVAPLGALRELDGYQWLLLLACHTERHVQQIDEITSMTA